MRKFCYRCPHQCEETATAYAVDGAPRCPSCTGVMVRDYKAESAAFARSSCRAVEK